MNIWLLQSSKVNSQMLILLFYQLGNFPSIGCTGCLFSKAFDVVSSGGHISCLVSWCHLFDKNLHVLSSMSLPLHSNFWVLIQKFQSPTSIFQCSASGMFCVWYCQQSWWPLALQPTLGWVQQSLLPDIQGTSRFFSTSLPLSWQGLAPSNFISVITSLQPSVTLQA